MKFTTTLQTVLALSMLMAGAVKAEAPAHAVSGPIQPAAELIAAAQSQAARSNKNVMVVFGASWCHWCKMYDKFIESPEIKPLISKAYEVVFLAVDDKELSNPGSDKLLEAAGGKDKGIPFFYVTDAHGTKLFDSLDEKGNNTGYPAQPAELEHYRALLEKTAPQITSGERDQIMAMLAPKPNQK